MPLNLVLHAKGVLKIRGKVENYNKNLSYTRIPANLRLKIFFEKIIIDISTLTWSKSRKKSINQTSIVIVYINNCIAY